MVEHDGQVGRLLKQLDDLAIANNTIVIYTTDNGAETFSWPDGGTTPFRGEKNTNWEGGYRVPAMVRWPGLVPPRIEINGVFSAEDWATTLVSAAGEPDIKNKLLQGYTAAGKNFRVHLDGYDQRDFSPARGRTSAANSSIGPMTATSPAFATTSGRRCSWNKRPTVLASGRSRWCNCACPSCSTCAPTRSNGPSTRQATMCAGSSSTPSCWCLRRRSWGGIYELPTVSAAPEARQLLGRTGDGETPEPAVQQLTATPTSTEPAMEPKSSSLGNEPSRPTRDIGRAAGPIGAASSRASPAQTATAASDPLPSWNDGPAKQAILDFVRATTDSASPNYVQPEERVATFDQDGTLWVEQPMYTQVIYCLERAPAVVKEKPELAEVEPFKTVLSGDREAMLKLSLKDMEKILAATLTGMSVERFEAEATKWLETARHPRWNRLYTEFVFQPMLEF